MRLAASLGVVLALVAGACSRPDSSGAGDLSATLNGSGATFPIGFYEVAIAGFQQVQPGVTVNYGGGGSGAGRQNLQDGVVDFAGSDALVKEEDKPKYRGELLYIPTVAAPITVSYNLKDVDRLTLDADTIARIFQRQITAWNDPALVALNPGVRLPRRDIIVARRADGSGTTENFTRYLAAAAPGTWTLRSGSSVEWPDDTQAGNGNQGVSQIVKSTNGAIGYVDFSDAVATKLRLATVRNKAGNAVAPSVAGAAAALAGATINPDLSYNPLNADGPDAYPVTAPTWILVYKNQTDRAKGEALQAFLRHVVGDAQKLAKDVDYAALPPDLQQKALAQVDAIVVPT